MARRVDLDAWDEVRRALRKNWAWAIALISRGRAYNKPPKWLLDIVARVNPSK